VSKKGHFYEKVSRILGRRPTIFLTPAVAGCQNPAMKAEVPIGCFCLTVIIEKDYWYWPVGVVVFKTTVCLA
jgi:hypothetical protein